MRQRLRARGRAVDDSDFGDAGVGERCHDGTRRATRAQHQGRTGCRIPIRSALLQVLAKAEGIRIPPLEFPVWRHNDRVDGADAPRQGLDAIDDRKRQLLVRDRQIATAKPEDRKRSQRLCDLVGPHR